jgi:hypothetical protein
LTIEDIDAQANGTHTTKEIVTTTLIDYVLNHLTIIDKSSKNKFRFLLDQLNIKSTCTEEDATEEITIKDICVLDNSITCIDKE